MEVFYEVGIRLKLKVFMQFSHQSFQLHVNLQKKPFDTSASLKCLSRLLSPHFSKQSCEACIELEMQGVGKTLDVGKPQIGNLFLDLLLLLLVKGAFHKKNCSLDP